MAHSTCQALPGGLVSQRWNSLGVGETGRQGGALSPTQRFPEQLRFSSGHTGSCFHPSCCPQHLFAQAGHQGVILGLSSSTPFSASASLADLHLSPSLPPPPPLIPGPSLLAWDSLNSLPAISLLPCALPLPWLAPSLHRGQVTALTQDPWVCPSVHTGRQGSGVCPSPPVPPEH